MNRITALIIALTAFATTGASQPAPEGAHPLTNATGTSDSYYGRTEKVIAHDASSEQNARVEAALARFEAAGLELPFIDIWFHDSTEPCRGSAGLYRPAAELSGLVDRVDVCNRLPHILVHELAHAWATNGMTSELRRATLDHWNLDAWADRDDDWGQRGTEMAAQTVAYTLTADTPSASEDIAGFICSYEIVTGSSHPAAVVQGCTSV